MPARTSRQRHNEHHHGTQQKRVHVTNTSKFLMERIRANLDEAARVLPEWFYVWTIQQQEPCPCKEAEFDTPDTCQLCHGVGILPGYSKRGFKTILPIQPNTTTYSVNGKWDYSQGKHHPSFRMDSTAVLTTVQSDWVPLVNNWGLDLVDVLTSGGVTVEATFDGVTWLDVLDDTFVDAFRQATRVKFMVTMARSDATHPRPEISGLKFRYQNVEFPAIRGDIPKFNFSRERDDLGIVPILETYNLAINYSETPDVRLNDFFEHIDANGGTDYRFKIVSHEPLQPLLTGGMPLHPLESQWGDRTTDGGRIFDDVQVRMIQTDEPLARVK